MPRDAGADGLGDAVLRAIRGFFPRRARRWIPDLAMPVGLGILSLQICADLFALLTGRQHLFGIEPGSSVAEAIAVRETGT